MSKTKHFTSTVDAHGEALHVGTRVYRQQPEDGEAAFATVQELIPQPEEQPYETPIPAQVRILYTSGPKQGQEEICASRYVWKAPTAN